MVRSRSASRSEAPRRWRTSPSGTCSGTSPGRARAVVFSDRAGAFTRATGCAREVEHECGVVREPGPKRSEDARVHEAKALKRDETDSEVWKMTSKVLAPWSGELE